MALTGKDGGVYSGANKVAELSNWSLDLGTDTPETTNFDSNGWKEYIAGLKEWSGSAEGNWKMSDTNGQKAIQDAWRNGTTLNLEFRVNPTNKYAGSVLITSIGIETPVDDKVTVSFEFQGTAALTPTVGS
ncbi:MAG: Phage major tail protein 2 [Bacteroidetes bacterium ADurb.BinA104]|nr:MAG: Phage major tail protein 2 [Bacteroidetes bacterium ADurb.BinA104]